MYKSPFKGPYSSHYIAAIHYLRMLRVFCLLLFGAFLAQAQKPFDVQALLKIQRLSDPRLSPDGKLVAFTVQTVDIEKNTKPQQIWVVPLDGGTPKKIAFEAS